MKIAWDEPKRLSNLDKHGMDFAEVTEEFLEQAVYYSGHRGRAVAVGELNGRIVAVIVAPLGSEAVSVISMRPANAKERKRRWS